MTEPTQTDLDYINDIKCVANAIGFEMLKYEKDLTTTKDGATQLWASEEEIERVLKCATRVVKEMIILGWTKAA